MYNLLKASYDLETMRAAALAYRRESQAGQLDGPPRTISRLVLDSCCRTRL